MYATFVHILWDNREHDVWKQDGKCDYEEYTSEANCRNLEPTCTCLVHFMYVPFSNVSTGPDNRPNNCWVDATSKIRIKAWH